jgi:hypothetical protein
MTMLLGRTVSFGIALLMLSAGSAVGLREANERASRPLLGSPVAFALDPVEAADQALTPNLTPDCAQLKRLALQAEVQVLAVQFAHQAQAADYAAQTIALQATIAQLQRITFTDAKTNQLRQAYLQRLQQVSQSPGVPIAQLAHQAQQVTAFNREQIIFNHCQN